MKLRPALTHKKRAGTASVDPLGPMFISYRRSDGLGHATDIAWALRSNGVPVWHDIADIPPGDTEGRLRDALNGGLSGAVLVATPELELSTVVRNIELPELLSLQNAGVDFIFAVANTISVGGALDFDAPDRVLRQRGGPLRRLKQYGIATSQELHKLAHEMALQRMAVLREKGDETVVLDVQTRTAPRAMTPHHALVFRTQPPEDGQRLPPSEIWPIVRAFLANLPKLVTETGATRVQVQGGAHLSVAFAIGAALPDTAAWPVTVVDAAGGTWASDESATTSASLTVSGDAGTGSGPVAAFIDLVPTSTPNAAFDDYVAASAVSATVRASAAERLDPSDGAATAEAIATRIRNAAGDAGTNKVSLFLRCPFTIAVLLGRLLNTLEVELFELDDTSDPARYVSVAVVASGRGGGPIVDVTATTSSGATT